MNYTLPVVWSLLLFGVLLAVLLGRKSSRPLGVAAGIGMLLFVGMNVALSACAEAKLCLALGDSGIAYTLYPFLGIPVFWLAAGLAARLDS
jgi:hypothetical protein